MQTGGGADSRESPYGTPRASLRAAMAIYAIAVLLGGACAARADEAATGGATKPSARQRTADRLRRIDADRDGFISRAEALRRAPRLAERFDAIDANRDGRLSPQEIRGEARSRRVSSVATQATSQRDARLAAADRDGDGRISGEEAAASLPRIAGKFARMDADGDGYVGAGELSAWIERRRTARRMKGTGG
jgi:hypothetical protein